MNNKYAIVILTHNLYFTEVALQNMPKQTDIDIIFINDVRYKDCMKGLTDLIIKYKLQMNARIFSSTKINSYIRSILKLTKDGNSFLDMYTMGMNINAQYFILGHPNSPYEKALFLDEDVLILRDMIDVFKKEKVANLRSILNTSFYQANDDYALAWQEMAGCDYETWKYAYINGGQRIYTWTKTFRDEYRNLLEKFYNTKVFYESFKRWKTTGKNKSKAFFMDQSFETSFLVRNNLQNDNIKQYVRYLVGSKCIEDTRKAKYLDRHLLHYAITVDKVKKASFLRVLKKEGLIK